MDLPGTADMFTVIVGFFLPLLVAVINKSTWPSYVRGVVSFLACLVFSAIDVFFVKNAATPENWARTFITIFFLAIATYHWYWKPTGIAPGIEKRILP